jgi:Domain of unknown function (DUF5666)
MNGATTSRSSAAWRRWPAALAGVGIVALAATACGGAASTVAPLAAANGSPSPTASQAAFPGVVGTAAAVSGSSLEVQNPTSGQVTVTFTGSTPITETLTVTSSAVTVGSCVAVTGQPSAGGAGGAAAGGGAAGGGVASSVTASTVTISSPVKGKCSAASGFGGGGGGFAPRPGSSARPRPSFSARPRPSGARGAFGGADGAVTSMSATGFVVQGRNRAAAAGTSITVTTTAATKYLKVVTARPSALKVGQCITAAGTANSIGAVAARSIRISQPGPGGCVTTFGRRGGFGTGGSGTGGSGTGGSGTGASGAAGNA